MGGVQNIQKKKKPYDSSEVYELLESKGMLVAWEDDSAEYLDEYRRHQNINALITSLEQLFQKYRIDIREKKTECP